MYSQFANLDMTSSSSRICYQCALGLLDNVDLLGRLIDGLVQVFVPLARGGEVDLGDLVAQHLGKLLLLLSPPSFRRVIWNPAVDRYVPAKSFRQSTICKSQSHILINMKS